MINPGGQWDYYIEYIVADANQQQAFVQQFYPQGQIPRFAVQATLPRLNELGAMGWELVQFQPFLGVGQNGDLLISRSEADSYASAFLCVFKRRRA